MITPTNTVSLPKNYSLKNVDPLGSNSKTSIVQKKASVTSTSVFNFLIAAGRSKRLINQELYHSIDISKTPINLVAVIPSVSDLVRGRAGSFWSSGSGLPQINATSVSNIAYGVQLQNPQYENTSSTSPLGQFVTNFTLVANKDLYHLNPLVERQLERITTFNSEYWRSFIAQSSTNAQISLSGNVGLVRDSLFNQQPISSSLGANIPLSLSPAILNLPPHQPKIKPTFSTEIFFDHAFELNIPFSKKELDSIGASIGVLFIDINPTYNFFIESYESVISTKNVSETLLPDMYVFCSELANEISNAKNLVFKEHITLNKTIPDVFVDITNFRGEVIGVADKGEYFDKYSLYLPNFIKKSESKFLVSQFTNQIIPNSNLKLLKNYNEKRQLFPMFFDISFSTDNATQFAQILQDSQLSTVLMRDIIENNIQAENLPFQESTINLYQRGQKYLKNVTSSKNTLRTWDIVKWVEKLSKSQIDSFKLLGSGIYLGPINDEIRLASSSQYELFKNFMVLIFIGKLRTLINNYLRSYEEIIKGKLAYSENVFYRIEKRDAETDTVIQNFYLPNSNNIDILRFIDTQVKYNKKYHYKIFVYQMVLGNKYSYKLNSLTNEIADLNAINEPSIKLVEVLFHEFTGRVLDSPPLSPEVNIIPYKGVNNQLLFNFDSAVGEYRLQPIIIEDNDGLSLKQIREAQMVSENELVLYKTDDQAAAFEIFRMDKKPFKYQDFRGNRIALVQTDIDSISLQKATSASFIDNILSNKKYYYIFRAVDNHNHISNPSAVYEVELVDANGSIYPVIQTIDFEKNVDLQAQTKAMKKFLQIVPAFKQKIINEEKSGLIVNDVRASSALGVEKIHLGLADEQVWGKLFRIRLSSKQTGKKIDLNISFDQKDLKRAV